MSISVFVVALLSFAALTGSLARLDSPTTLFLGLSREGPFASDPASHTITTYYLGPTSAPIKIAGGVKLVPDYTFDQVCDGEIKLDVLLVPGAENMSPSEVNRDARELLIRAVPEMSYVLTGALDCAIIAFVFPLT